MCMCICWPTTTGALGEQKKNRKLSAWFFFFLSSRAEFFERLCDTLSSALFKQRNQTNKEGHDRKVTFQKKIVKWVQG